MAKIATKRTSNYVNHDEKMYIEIANTGVTIFADKVSGYATEEYYPETGDTESVWHDDFYVLTSHEGMMPAFHEEEFPTIEELCKHMKELNGDLRKWRVVPEEAYS